MPWCGKFNRRTGTCPHGCTWRNFACHRYSRGKTCMETPCPYVHVEPQCDADGAFVSSSAGARHRSRSPQLVRTPSPSPRTREALLLIGIDSNEAGITKGRIGTNYRQEMRKWHPDKLEAICRSKTQQITNAKAYLDGVYR
jgi:hypothetical protein